MDSINGVVHQIPRVDEDYGHVVGRIAAQLRATVPWLPVWIAVATVALFVTQFGVTPDADAKPDLILVAVVVGVALWVGFAIVINHQVLPHLASRRSYADLTERIEAASSAVGLVLRRPNLSDVDGARLADLREEIVLLDRDLDSQEPGPEWATGMGYINIWRRLHRIEEALIPFADDAELGEVLAHDRLRVAGSKLAKSDSMLADLIKEARAELEKGPLPGSAGTVPAPGTTRSGGLFYGASLRSKLRTIRTTVNEYRDDQFEGLVNARARLDSISAAVGLISWAILALAIVSRAPGTAVASVAAFYLFGAGAGLVTQLRSVGPGESSQDIYGYGHAQIRQTMLLSGLAAVVGVIVTWIATDGANADMYQLTQALTARPTMFLTAILFGLAPGTLLDRLHDVAKTRIGDLESTLATGTGEKEASS